MAGHFVGSWVLTNDYVCEECGSSHLEMADWENDDASEQRVRLHCLACDARWWKE